MVDELCNFWSVEKNSGSPTLLYTTSPKIKGTMGEDVNMKWESDMEVS